MNKKSRLKVSALNSSIMTGTQIMTILLRFITQTIFIRTLGFTYLGVNGLFTNILGVLSFADLGIGAAITYSLYKPIAEENFGIINSIMTFYRKAYHLIGLVITILGVSLIPFLGFFIKNNTIPNLDIIFILFLLNTVISYFFSYNQTLLIADQQGYKGSIIQFIFLIIKAILQICVLIFWKNFILYLIIQISATLFTNLTISKIVRKQYPKLNLKEYQKIPYDIYENIKANTIGMIGSKVGEVSLSASDNIIISTFIGLHTVGIYSNYVLIINSVNALLMQFVGSVSASVGNFAISVSNKTKQYKLFRRHLFINYFVTLVATACLEGLLNPFITLWVGNDHILSEMTVTLLTVNFAMISLRQTPVTFISSYGLFKKIGVKSIIEAIINVGLSLLFVNVYSMGIEGVLLGTLLSNIFINFFYEPFVVIKYGIGVNKYVDFYKNYVVDLFIIIGTSYLLHKLIQPFQYKSLFGMISLFFIEITFSSIFFIVLNYRSDEFKYFYTILKRFLKRQV